MSRLLLAALALLPGAAFAQTAEAAAEPATNWTAIAMFVGFVGVTLAITYWAATRTKTTSDFYSAGGGITGFQNGIAIAGDYMSAASFLGISALVYSAGYDGLIYSIGFIVGWPILMFLMAERLRNLGKFTFADVVSYRLAATPMRAFAATSTLVVVAFYLIAQIVGAGQLIGLLFPGIEYQYAVVLVGVLMILYVTFGGMIATTWVQIIKALLLLSGATLMAVLALAQFGFDVDAFLAKAIELKGATIMLPHRAAGMSESTYTINAISLGIALMFGTAGLPHILMRFFTVRDQKEARKSVFFATGLIGYFYILTFIIGFGAIIFVSTNPSFLDAKGALIGGGNMAAVRLAQALGGNLLFGFISAVAFATILAVVSGLTLSGASAVSHDIYASVIRRGRVSDGSEVRVSRIATVVLGIVAVALGIVFEKVNVAFMVGLAFAIAASANFPILLLSMYWRGLTTSGAFCGGFAGLISAVGLTIVSPGIWVLVLGHPVGSALFPYSSPALFTMPLAFLVAFAVSKLDRSAQARREALAFEAQYVRAATGIGIEGAAAH